MPRPRGCNYQIMGPLIHKCVGPFILEGAQNPELLAQNRIVTSIATKSFREKSWVGVVYHLPSCSNWMFTGSTMIQWCVAPINHWERTNIIWPTFPLQLCSWNNMKGISLNREWTMKALRDCGCVHACMYVYIWYTKYCVYMYIYIYPYIHRETG